MKILLVEPDALLARTYQSALEQAGHEVVVTSTAQVGIHAVDMWAPQLIILELQLVSHSGLEFLYELRSYEDWQKLPVLIQSQVPIGEFADSWQTLQQDLNVHDYLYKPRTSLGKLVSVVEKMGSL